MIGSDMIRGYTDLMILYLLIERDSYGYEISKQIRNLAPEDYEMKETTLYSAINRLEKNGFVTSYKNTAESGKKRTYYTLTSEGQAHYNAKCDEWQMTKRIVDRFVKGD